MSPFGTLITYMLDHLLWMIFFGMCVCFNLGYLYWSVFKVHLFFLLWEDRVQVNSSFLIIYFSILFSLFTFLCWNYSPVHSLNWISIIYLSQLIYTLNTNSNIWAICRSDYMTTFVLIMGHFFILLCISKDRYLPEFILIF